MADEARGPVTLSDLPNGLKVLRVNGGDFGYTARSAGMAAATGTHLCFLDDDDVYTPEAVGLFKKHASDVPTIFRMDHYAHGILWREPKLEFGNVSTQMFVVPNKPELFGEWSPHMPGLPEPGGDYTFLAGCCERMGDPVWREEIVAVLRPEYPSVTAVTCWLDHLELVDDYLDAMSALGPRDRCIVIDQGSEHDLAAQLMDPRVTVVRNEENVGFCAGSNQGLALAETPCVLMLNNDIAATNPNWLNLLRAEMREGQLVGAQLRFNEHADVDGVPMPYLDGWCLGGMTQDLRDLGGFDETLLQPGYYSDNVLCLRARAAGFNLREVQTGLVHLCGVTSEANRGRDVSASTLANYNRYAEEARALLEMPVAA